MADALEHTMRARIRLIRNGVDYHDQTFYEPDITYTESTHQRLVLATSMPSPVAIDLSGVSAAKTLFLQTDRDILVAVNGSAKTWPVNENGALMLVGTFTTLHVQNESSINQATIELVVTD